MRIVFCLNDISIVGGIERVTIVKANALAAIEGNEVWIITALSMGRTIYKIDERVRIVNLKVDYYKDDWGKNRLQQFINIYLKNKEHRHKMHDVLRSICPDIVVSTGSMEKLFLPFFSDLDCVFVREIHFTSDYRHIIGNSLYTKILYRMGEFCDYKFVIKKYDQVVVLTQEDKDRFWKNNNKVVVIPNPISIQHNQYSVLKNKTAISIGRLEREKNYGSLVHSWVKVHTEHNDWKLEIWGAGTERENLERMINNLSLQDSVLLKGLTDDVISVLEKASIFVMSSKHEGFCLAITEAMSCGLPVVSYDCPCGPKDIITEGKDGFLVPMGDEQALAKRICYLIEHENERRTMGDAALEKSKQYALDIIIEKWMNLFKNLMGKSKR